MILEQIFEHHPNEVFMIADGFDEAAFGVAYGSPMRLIYSVSKCLEILVRGGMDEEEASEYFDFNVAGAYMGEQTPIWHYDVDE